MRSVDFQTAVLRNPVNGALLDGLIELGLHDAWIVAGCLVQTVWNLRTGRSIDYGIHDYDVFYFDSDLSWEAEDRVICALRPLSSRLGVRIEARNQARVHLWFPQKHGRPYPALQRATDGIDRFLTRNTQVGIQRRHDGDRIYAPAGLDDIPRLIARPNLAPNFSAEAYRIKTARWKALWPELTVLLPEADVVVAGCGVSLVTFDDVRKLALAWPEVEDGTSYGTPALKVRKKLLVRLKEDGDSLVMPGVPR